MFNSPFFEIQFFSDFLFFRPALSLVARGTLWVGPSVQGSLGAGPSVMGDLAVES